MYRNYKLHIAAAFFQIFIFGLLACIIIFKPEMIALGENGSWPPMRHFFLIFAIMSLLVLIYEVYTCMHDLFVLSSLGKGAKVLWSISLVFLAPLVVMPYLVLVYSPETGESREAATEEVGDEPVEEVPEWMNLEGEEFIEKASQRPVVIPKKKKIEKKPIRIKAAYSEESVPEVSERDSMEKDLLDFVDSIDSDKADSDTGESFEKAKWYVLGKEKKFGPYDVDKLREYVAKRKISGRTKLQRAGNKTIFYLNELPPFRNVK